MVAGAQKSEMAQPGPVAGDYDSLTSLLKLVNFALLAKDGFREICRPQECVLLLHIHLLPSTVGFFERLKDLGFDPAQIIVIPKSYSTIAAVPVSVKNLGCVVLGSQTSTFEPGGYSMAAKADLKCGVSVAIARCRRVNVKRCVLVDDGGLLTDTWCAASNKPDIELVSVQQTGSGMYWRRLLSPASRISVARSPAKQFFESKIVAQGVLDKVANMHLLKKPRKLAVIGLGNIGSRLVPMLRSQGHRVYCYDLNPLKAPNITGRQDSWRACVDLGDIVFGCTGRNITHHRIDDTLQMANRKVFISLSSRDVEFQTLLQLAKRRPGASPYDTVEVSRVGTVSHLVFNGGFPINFDREKEWESKDDIALTRSLVLLGILQGLCTPYSLGTFGPDKLALLAQRTLVSEWLRITAQSSCAYGVEEDDLEDPCWWHNKSRQSRIIDYSPIINGSNR